MSKINDEIKRLRKLNTKLEIIKYRKEGVKINDIVEKTKSSRSTVFRVLKDFENNACA